MPTSRITPNFEPKIRPSRRPELEILRNSGSETFFRVDTGMIGVELIGTRFVQKKNLF